MPPIIVLKEKIICYTSSNASRNLNFLLFSMYISGWKSKAINFNSCCRGCVYEVNNKDADNRFRWRQIYCGQPVKGNTEKTSTVMPF